MEYIKFLFKVQHYFLIFSNILSSTNAFKNVPNNESRMGFYGETYGFKAIILKNFCVQAFYIEHNKSS